MEEYSLEELECVLYVEFKCDRDDLKRFLIRQLGGVVENCDVITKHARFSVSQNRPPGYKIKDRVFDAKYRVEVFPADKVIQEEYIQMIASVLQRFWSLKIDAAALADFEEYLPLLGGYGEYPLSE
jgi:hypothetical protein